MAWLLLISAGLLETVWAFYMKKSDGFTLLWPTVITGVTMLASFALLSVSMKTLPLSSAYVVWTGIGSVGAFILGVMVLGAGVGVVDQAQTAFAQPVAELDVLDAGAAVALGVEAAVAQKHIPAHGAAAAPKARRLLGAVLVDVVVEEILDLRQEIRCAWRVVVRAEQRGQTRVVGEGPGHQADRLRPNRDVGIHEEDHIAGRGLDAQVARHCRPAARFARV